MTVRSRMAKAKFTSRTGSTSCCLSGSAVSSSISALTLAQCNFLFLACIQYIFASSLLLLHPLHNNMYITILTQSLALQRELFVQPPNLAVLTYLHISRCKKRFRTPSQLQSFHINSLKADAEYFQKTGLFYWIFMPRGVAARGIR